MKRRCLNMSGCHDGGFGVGGGFAFIVVLFILLIIVGASFCGGFGGMVDMDMVEELLQHTDMVDTAEKIF